MSEFSQVFNLHKGHLLLGPENFFKLSPGQLKQISNGCGPKGLLGPLVPETMHGLDVSAGCDIHDYRYRFSNFKFRSDIEMLGNHARIIADSAKKDGKWITTKRLYRATFYATVVIMFGGKAFKNAKSAENMTQFEEVGEEARCRQ